MMKKYMEYLPIGSLCFVVLFSQLLYARHSDFHAELGTIAHKGERIGDPDTIKDLVYSFYITDTNLGGYSGEGDNTWRIDVQGESFKISYDLKGYRQHQMTVEDDVEVFFSVNVSPKYDEKTMLMNGESKQSDTDFYNGASIHSYKSKIERLPYELVIGRHHVEGGASISGGEDNVQLLTVKARNGKCGLAATYHEESAENRERVYIYLQVSVRNVDDKYGSLENCGFLDVPIVKLGKENFTTIGALQFEMNFNEVGFEKDPTGIYHAEESGKLTPLVPMDVSRETVLHMEVSQGKLIVVVEKDGYLYDRTYSSRGVLLDGFQFSFDLQNTNRMILPPKKEYVLFVQEPVYDGDNRDLLVYGTEQEQFKRINRMSLNGLNITNISGNYANTLLYYRKDTGILHIVVSDDGKALCVAAQTNKKLLYRSILLGDYTDGSKLALPDATQITTGNAYGNIMSYVLNIQKRTLQNPRLVQGGDV